MDTVNNLMKIEDSLLQTAKELATVRAGLAGEAELHKKRNSDTLIVRASIRDNMLNLQTDSKKSGLNLWGAAVVLARAAIRLEARSINAFVEDLSNPNI